MDAKNLAEILLLIMALLIILYNFLTTLGGSCFDTFSIILSLFALLYSLLLRFF